MNKELLQIMASEEERKKVVATKKKKREILFIQHSSAGDVLMSTQCFKGIKERYQGKKLVYMTQKQYIDIVEGNPYIDEIVEWNPDLASEYLFVYNPHGEKILPGGFNSLDTKLADMYPYFCHVKADRMFIKEEPIDFTLPESYIVVHTTGGSEFRIYKNMSVVSSYIINTLGIPVVQIGGENDYPAKSTFDLRGKLTFRQTAYVMKRAKAAIVMDSFPSHLCGAVGTPAVVIYGPAPARVTQPITYGTPLINIEPNKLDVCPSLTNCWGENKSCQNPCIDTIDPYEVIKAVKELIK